jgi:hypothetical protein
MRFGDLRAMMLPVQGHSASGIFPLSGMFGDWRCLMRNYGEIISRPHLFMGLTFITAGVVILLDNVGLAPLDNYWQYWPLVLVIIGVTRLVDDLWNIRREEDRIPASRVKTQPIR